QLPRLLCRLGARGRHVHGAALPKLAISDGDKSVPKTPFRRTASSHAGTWSPSREGKQKSTLGRRRRWDRSYPLRRGGRRKSVDICRHEDGAVLPERAVSDGYESAPSAALRRTASSHAGT